MAFFGVFVGFANGSGGAMLGGAVAMLMVGGAADMVSAAFRQSMLMTAASDDVRGRLQGVFLVVVAGGPRIADVAHGGAAAMAEIGRASCRERGCQDVWISVVAGSSKKKNRHSIALVEL